MSGNFTQRGEPAVLNKFIRAKHAIIAGADMVIELPTVFATANAEIFAKGAINVVNSLGIVDSLCFGVEGGDKDSFIRLADAMNDESKDFKRALKEQLDKGVSLAKAKFLAVQSMGSNFDESLVSAPNNILGLEYVKALRKLDSDINVFPMIREGDHNDATLKKGITSASSIRQALKNVKTAKKVKGNVPPHVFEDLNGYPTAFDKMIMATLLQTNVEDLAKVLDCTEGLENRIKALSKDARGFEALIEKVSTKRYTASRVRRIVLSNFLGITEDLVKDCLQTPLYAKVLAVNSQSKDLISLLGERCSVPVLTRKSDVALLKKTSKQCFEKDLLANDLYNLATNTDFNENYMLMI
jgi:predicted nucleotidyltransferase